MADGEGVADTPVRRFVALVVVVTLAVGIGVVAQRWKPARQADPPAVAATVTPGVAAQALTPFETAEVVLKAQAAALIDGDEQAWMAAVDPAQAGLRSRYRRMFRNLRALHVSHFEYHLYIHDLAEAGGPVEVGIAASYCFSVVRCPGYSDTDHDGPPRISQMLTLKPVRGRYVITRIGRANRPSHLQPAPWENDELVFAQGRRVTVAAPRSQARHLETVLRHAEAAAAVNDRFAGYVHNPQQRYRVYLASEKAWRTWYQRLPREWVIGYEIPLNDAGGDVVLRMSRMSDSRELRTALQHELAHVVTLTSRTHRNRDDQWLQEGVAEYIGGLPGPATRSGHRSSVRAAVHGRRPPTSIVAKPLPDDAGDATVDTFYGLGHFAVACMAVKFGERRLFEFVRLRLRAGDTYDEASRKAFGKPFAAVDRSCTTWIRRNA